MIKLSFQKKVICLGKMFNWLQYNTTVKFLLGCERVDLGFYLFGDQCRNKFQIKTKAQQYFYLGFY